MSLRISPINNNNYNPNTARSKAPSFAGLGSNAKAMLLAGLAAFAPMASKAADTFTGSTTSVVSRAASAVTVDTNLVITAFKKLSDGTVSFKVKVGEPGWYRILASDELVSRDSTNWVEIARFYRTKAGESTLKADAIEPKKFFGVGKVTD